MLVADLVCGHLLCGEDALRPFSALQNLLDGSSCSHQGHGFGITAGQCILVLQDRQNDAL